MNLEESAIIRVSGIDVASDRFHSVKGPAMHELPSWGLSMKTEHMEYHLHPAILFEVHYQFPFYLLIHTFNGADGRLAIGDGDMIPWRSEARGTCIVPPGLRMRIIQETPLEFIGIGVSREFFEGVARKVAPRGQSVESFFKTMDPALSALFTEVRRTMISEPFGVGSYLDALSGAIVTRMISQHFSALEDQPPKAEMLPPSVVKRIVQLIEGRLDGPIRAGDLAAEFGLSRSHFSRAFSKSFGVPAQNYILSRRIAKARSLLSDTQLPIGEIAIQCGFSNPSHLTTSFQSELGLSPKQYRQALQET